MISSKSYSMKKEDLVKGILLCLNNVNQLLEKIDLTVKKKTDNSIALGLYSFAVEEFGKALLLKDYLIENKENYEITRPLFWGNFIILLVNP